MLEKTFESPLDSKELKLVNIKKTKIVACTINSQQIEGQKAEAVTDFSWAPKSLQNVTAAIKLKDACSLEEKL